MKTIKRNFKNEGIANNENCSVFDTQVEDIKASRKKFDDIMTSKLVKDKENADVKDVKTSNIEELSKRGKEMRRNANIKESRKTSSRIRVSKRVTERLHQLREDKVTSMTDIAKEPKLTSDEIFDIVDHDLRNSDDVAIQVDDRVFICGLRDLPRSGVPSSGKFRFKGCEVTSRDIEDVDGQLMMQDCGEEKSYEVVDGKIVKEKLTEAPVRDLDTVYDSRKSFYGKARVNELPNGSKVLYSYDTPVVGIREGKVTLLRRGYLGWSSSATTLRHVKDFLQQEGFKSGSYKELANMYPIQSFDAWERHEPITEVRVSKESSTKVSVEHLNEDAITGEKVSFDTIRKWLKTTGATIEAKTARAINYDDGYEISFYGEEKVFKNLDLDNDKHINKVLKEVNMRLASSNHPFIGLWAEDIEDSKNKNVYVDYSEHFMGSEEEALKLGAERHQKSILRWSDMAFLSTDNHTSMKESKELTSKEKLTGRVLKKKDVIEDTDKACVEGECTSKKLNEGYLGQTLRDFFDVCVEPEINITKVVLSDINEDDFDDSVCFNGSYDELTDVELNYEFHEFDTFGEGITINVGVDSGDDFYTTVEDFLGDCNEDEITIYDLDKGEVIFEGDRYEIPDDILEMQFASFDAPKKITINVTCGEDYEDDVEEFDSYDEDDSFDTMDESLKITSDISSYTPWSGAVETFEKIKDAGMIDDLDFLLEDIYPDGITETQLNDILWFDADWVLESLGLKEEEYEEDDYE